MMYKKLSIPLVIFIAFIPSAFAVDQTFNDPRWSDISSSASFFWNIPSNTRIRWNTLSASQYCIEVWGTFTSFSSNNIWNITTARYNSNFSDWQTSWNDNFSDVIICNMPDPDFWTWSLINSFVEIDFSEITYDNTVVTTWTGETISYTSIFQDTNRLLYQILYVLTTLTFFMSIWIFYTFINDLLWKR